MAFKVHIPLLALPLKSPKEYIRKIKQAEFLW
jgi:hypothetical protein